MTTRQLRIQKILTDVFNPTHLEIVNESHLHAGHRQESHFKVHIVSPAFNSVPRLERQRKIHDQLKSEFESGLHALTLRAQTPEEWSEASPSEKFVSPACSGNQQKLAPSAVGKKL
jgi:stress-induced morphogen